MRVLVIEDHERMAELIRRGLQEEAYAVDVAMRAEDGLRLASSQEYDLVVLDLVLPDLDGFETLRRIRAAGQWAPVLVLTARDAVDDRVKGLDAGADDYLTKPFALRELVARLRALARRRPALTPALHRVADLEVDLTARQARRGGRPLRLSAKEFALLEL